MGHEYEFLLRQKLDEVGLAYLGEDILLIFCKPLTVDVVEFSGYFLAKIKYLNYLLYKFCNLLSNKPLSSCCN